MSEPLYVLVDRQSQNLLGEFATRAEAEATREAYVEADPRCAPDLAIVFDDGVDEPGDASAIDAAGIP